MICVVLGDTALEPTPINGIASGLATVLTVES